MQNQIVSHANLQIIQNTNHARMGSVIFVRFGTDIYLTEIIYNNHINPTLQKRPFIEIRLARPYSLLTRTGGFC